MPNDQEKVYDAVVIGTGFAGAVTACRLVEAGFEICVLERGRRYEAADFPAPLTADLFNPGNAPGTGATGDFSRWLWSSDHGLFDVRDLDGAVAVQSAGYGGGSLIYANVHLRPPKKVFDAWPAAYRDKGFDEYFDLAAFMLGATPIPTRLAKTVQLQSAAETITGDHQWFRTPLAITFQRPDGIATTAGNISTSFANAYGREQHVCDMRGRCFLGCDRQAKNTLDLNYLARAEDGDPDIRTLAEVTTIARGDDGIFTVTYRDHLFNGAEVCIPARHVFLCAGAVGTTELLLNNPDLTKVPDAVGSHYFPNSDAFAAVFDCDKPQEADYGPTITAALVHNRPFDGRFKQSLDVYDGHLTNPQGILPAAGMTVRGMRSGATADLGCRPFLDRGGWEKGGAAGYLVVALLSKSPFQEGEEVAIVTTADEPVASALVRATLREHEHWFLVEDGGYPTDFTPFVGLFRSPLWLRRNRFLEVKPDQVPAVTAEGGGRRSAERAQVRAIAAALGNTTSRASSPDGYLGRSFSTGRTGNVRAHLPDVLQQQVSTFFPDWFGDALKDARADMFEQAANAALPMLGQLLDRFSTSIVTQADRGGFAFLPDDIEGNDQKKQVLVRGMLRQALQIVAGSEATVARLVTDLLLERFKGTPEGLLQMVSDALLWVLAYGSAEGNTALLLTMGRDPFRGRLLLDPDAPKNAPRIVARLPSSRIDSSVVEQEQLLREIAKEAWHGELRTNPLWTPIEKRVTVHSQGGCPMGDGDDESRTPADTHAAQMARCFSVTDPLGRVRGCDGLYVMDAAAFPTSVGVNPSATIAAVAEFKVEQFIRRARPELSNWEARDKRDARVWCDTRRADIDPLNAPRTVAPAAGGNPAPAVAVIGLTFEEQMQGFLSPIRIRERFAVDLAGFEKRKAAFVADQDRGIREGAGIKTTLMINVSDLAELVSPELAEDPARAKVTGSITLTLPGEAPMKLDVRDDSVVQFFIKPPDTGGPPTRFFRYSLNVVGRISGHLDGVKMLVDDPGQDVWIDTSTLYFELTTADEVYRGIMRLSLEEFLQIQLPSMRVTNVDDSSRQAWALTAFYAYFARNLTDVYMRRLHTLTTLAVNVLTGIHV